MGIEIQNRQFQALGDAADYLLPTLTQNYAGFFFTEMPVGQRLHLQASTRIEDVQIEGTPFTGLKTSRGFTPLSAALGGLFDLTDEIKLGLTGSTTARAPDFAFLELDLLKVKGKTEAKRVFALLGDSAVKQSQGFIDLAMRHNEFLQRYRAMDWNAAEALNRECDEHNGCGLERLYALYRERIAFFRHNQPPPHWDGSAEAHDK